MKPTPSRSPLSFFAPTRAALTLALLAVALWLAPTRPASSQAAAIEHVSLAVQLRVDEALGATGTPAPPPLHLDVPAMSRLPLTGQPFEQQPAAAQGDFRPGGAGRR